MSKYIKDNDLYNDKVDTIKSPLIKEMEDKIKNYKYSDLKETIIQTYKLLGYNIISTGIRKFGVVILRVSNNECNDAVVIFPYENPISGYTISSLSKIIIKIKPEVDHMTVITKFGEYKFSSSYAALSTIPFDIMSAQDISKLIWKDNSQYFSNLNNKDKYINCNTPLSK